MEREITVAAALQHILDLANAYLAPDSMGNFTSSELGSLFGLPLDASGEPEIGALLSACMNVQTHPVVAELDESERLRVIRSSIAYRSSILP